MCKITTAWIASLGTLCNRQRLRGADGLFPALVSSLLFKHWRTLFPPPKLPRKRNHVFFSFRNLVAINVTILCLCLSFYFNLISVALYQLKNLCRCVSLSLSLSLSPLFSVVPYSFSADACTFFCHKPPDSLWDDSWPALTILLKSASYFHGHKIIFKIQARYTANK